MDDYVISDDDEVEDRVINNHQCEILMPHKVKVALQDLRSIFSLFCFWTPIHHFRKIFHFSVRSSHLSLSLKSTPRQKKLLLVRVALHAGKMDQVGGGGAEENLG